MHRGGGVVSCSVFVAACVSLSASVAVACSGLRAVLLGWELSRQFALDLLRRASVSVGTAGSA